MLARISPWGLGAFILGVVGLLAASLVGIRSLTAALAAAGVVVACLGALVAWKTRNFQAEFWTLLGGTLSGHSPPRTGGRISMGLAPARCRRRPQLRAG